MTDRETIWASFFVCAASRTKKESSTLEDDAKQADRMMVEFDKRFPESALMHPAVQIPKPGGKQTEVKR